MQIEFKTSNENIDKKRR